MEEQNRWPRRLTIRDWLVLISVAVFGVSFWIIERDWYWGALAAISVCIVLGLAAQVHDLGRGSKRSEALTSEEHWGRRFAVAWRLVVICLMVASFFVRLLVQWKVLALDPGNDTARFYLGGMHDAVLLVAIIAAIASSPRPARRAERRWWSWAAELLGGIAACVLCAILLMDHVLIPLLVHITVANIEMAQPLRFSSEALAAYDPKRLARFFDVTTAGVVSVLVSCVLLRLLSLCWWRGARWRACLGVLLAASLTTTIMLSARIALVDVPDITPALAAEIHMPRPHHIVAAAVLTLLLISAAARRLSEPSPVAVATGDFAWRRDEQRYYHERRIVVLLLAGVMLVKCAVWLHDQGVPVFDWEDTVWYLVMGPVGCLPLALICLAVQSVSSGWSNCSSPASMERPRLAPGLFLLVWSVLVAIIVFGVPILGAWGFALGFNHG